MTKALGWLQAGKICNSEGVTVVELNAGHKRGILRKVFEDPSIPREKKMAMMEEVMGDDKSDLAENLDSRAWHVYPMLKAKPRLGLPSPILILETL